MAVKWWSFPRNRLGLAEPVPEGSPVPSGVSEKSSTARPSSRRMRQYRSNGSRQSPHCDANCNRGTESCPVGGGVAVLGCSRGNGVRPSQN